jgi:hypothetical protein
MTLRCKYLSSQISVFTEYCYTCYIREEITDGLCNTNTHYSRKFGAKYYYHLKTVECVEENY